MSVAARPIVEVAVGVLVRADGCVLLADRPAGKPYAGFWEFPGGKVEPGETVEAALARELFEELGVRIGPAPPWVCFEHSYPHARVRLHFHRVEHWSGEPQAHEGQRLCFVDPHGTLPAPLLPAALPPLRWLLLPAVVAPSAAGALGLDEFLARLERAVAAGLRAVLIDEPALLPAARTRCIQECAMRLAAVGGTWLRLSTDAAVSGDEPNHLDPVPGTMATRGNEGFAAPSAAAIPAWRGARAASAAEIARAARTGCDFAVAGPILADPAAAAVGWAGFASAVRQTPLPVYACGGLQRLDLEAARRRGAHGVLLDLDCWNCA